MQQAKGEQQGLSACVQTQLPPIFYDMPRPEQRRTEHVAEHRRLLECPEGFFGADHPNTAWLVNLLRDSCEGRLQKALASRRLCALFDSSIYYQLADRPGRYLGAQARTAQPLFKSHSMLYLNAFAVCLYLRAAVGCEKLATGRSSRGRLVDIEAPQFASFVHDRTSDLMQFRCDFMCVKLEYYDGLQYLAQAGWNPNSQSLFTYRRKYYQYSVPFTDWVDVTRFLLEQKPQLNAAALVTRMFTVPYVAHSEHSFSMLTYKEVGKVMLEPFELLELTESTTTNSRDFGKYAGRKLLRDKHHEYIPEEYKRVFSPEHLHPVVPNIMSYPRRLLTFQYYHDGHHLYSLPQVLRAVDVFRRNGFFIPLQSLKNSMETDSTGQHVMYLDPLLFQINYYLNLKVGDQLTRHKQWKTSESSISSSYNEEERCWIYRFDTINCVSLLAGLLQNSLIKNSSDILVDAVCNLIIHTLVDAELIEAFMRYSYYDTYFGLTSVVNCVPNLMSRTVLRLMLKTPITLVDRYDLPFLQRAFSSSFWTVRGQLKVPRTMDDMAECLVNKRRRVSMQVEGPATDESVSSVSAAGTSGSVVKFIRNYASMMEITAQTESADQVRTDSTKRLGEERRHVKEYKQMEVDVRYSSVYPLYHSALDKTLIEWDESLTYSQCLRRARSRWQLAASG